jgi:hypothetical protein
MLDPDLEKMHKDFLESSKYMSSKFQDSIRSFDGLKDLVARFNVLVGDLATKVNANQTEYEKFVEWSKSVRDGSVTCHNSLKDLVEVNSSAINSFRNDLEKTQKLYTDLAIDHTKTCNRVTSLEIKSPTYLTPDHLATLNRRVNDLEAYVDKHLVLVECDQQKLERAHDNLKDQVTQIAADLNQNANVANSAREVANLATARIVDLKVKFSDSIANIMRQVPEEIEERLKQLPKPQIPDYSAQIKSIEAQHEPIRFDAANAKLRSENTEKKMFLLEKKVEQLQLLLDKLKLGG